MVMVMNVYQYIGAFVCLIFLSICATYAPISQKLKSFIWDLVFVVFVVVELI